MDTRIALLNEDTWTFINASLLNGTGLTVACEGMHVDIVAMSDFLREKTKIMAECERQTTQGYKALITLINNHAAKARINQWRAGHKALREFIKGVNLWEQHCTRDEATPHRIAEAFHTYQHLPEVATVCGFRVPDFYQYVLGDVNLKTYLQELGFLPG